MVLVNWFDEDTVSHIRQKTICQGLATSVTRTASREQPKEDTSNIVMVVYKSNPRACIEVRPD